MSAEPLQGCWVAAALLLTLFYLPLVKPTAFAVVEYVDVPTRSLADVGILALEGSLLLAPCFPLVALSLVAWTGEGAYLSLALVPLVVLILASVGLRLLWHRGSSHVKKATAP